MARAQQEPDATELHDRVVRYQVAGPLRKAAMRLVGDAPTPQQREQDRRRDLGVEGRLAEDVVRVVEETGPIWSILGEHDLPEDITIRELSAISHRLLGHLDRPGGVHPLVDVSLAFDDPRNVDILRRVLRPTAPALDVSAYRYATLGSLTDGASEPFVVALRRLPSRAYEVTATMLLAATFLRHEQQFGILFQEDLEQLGIVVRLDLLETIRTRGLLRDL